MEMVARFAMRGMKAAVSMVCLFFLLGLFLRPLLLISSALIALVTLRDGPVRAIKVAAVSLLLFLAVSYTLLGQGSNAMFLPILLWLPMIFVVLPLRQTQNYNLTLLLCGVVVVNGYHYFGMSSGASNTYTVSEFLENLDSPYASKMQGRGSASPDLGRLSL